MLAESVIVLDFETTGLRSDLGDRVTEMAALRVCGNRIIERFETLVNCDMRVPAYITGYTGITQSMVDSAPDARHTFRDLLSFIGSEAVVAHNAGFDQGFLDSECRRLGLINQTSDFICSFQIARRLFPQFNSHALGCLASRLDIPFMPGAHRAGVDATVTANILLRVCKDLCVQLGMAAVDVHTLRRVARTGLTDQQDDYAIASAA